MACFEVSAAYAMGVLFPVLETARRRTNFENPHAYIDDFIVGGLLLWAAAATSRRRAYGPALLCAAWGVLCGGLWGSFFWQLQSASASDVSGLPNLALVVIKGGLYAVAPVGIVQSVRRAAA